MIDVKVTVEGASAGPQVAASLEKVRLRVEGAVERATKKLADSILAKGRADISGAGKFGARWTQGLTAGITGEKAVRTITVREAVPYWRVFQYGAIIKGRPLLYFKPSPEFANLFRRKDGSIPEVISVPEVRIPKKFHLVEIARAEAGTFGALYHVEMASE